MEDGGYVVAGYPDDGYEGGGGENDEEDDVALPKSLEPPKLMGAEVRPLAALYAAASSAGIALGDEEISAPMLLGSTADMPLGSLELKSIPGVGASGDRPVNAFDAAPVARLLIEDTLGSAGRLKHVQSREFISSFFMHKQSN